jgi:Polysaccharide lyase
VIAAESDAAAKMRRVLFTLVVLGLLACSGQAAGAVWSTSFERGTLDEWCVNAGMHRCTQNSGDAVTGVSSARAHTGRYSMVQTINTTRGKAGARQTRYAESSVHGGDYVYTSWYFLPRRQHPTRGMWNVMQFKAKEPDEGPSHPFWTINLVGNPLYLVLKWKGGSDKRHAGVPGPHATDPIGDKQWRQRRKPVPVGRWFKISVRMRMTSNYTGLIVVRQDGTELFRFKRVRSTFTRHSRQSWGVCNYSNGLAVNPYSLFTDDASIKRK